MTSQEATTFETYSAKNAEILETACAKCEPYKDWFTFGRWHAQEKHVLKGEHGTRILKVIENKSKDLDPDEETQKFIRFIPVFCRHQVS